MKAIPLFLFIFFAVIAHASQSNLQGTLTSEFYLSPSNKYVINFPVSPHKFEYQESINEEKGEEKFTILDEYGMQLSVLVSEDKFNADWLELWYKSLPEEVEMSFGTMKIEKAFTTDTNGVKSVLLIKGPIVLEGNRVVYVVNQIFVLDGYIYDISATNHYITTNMLDEKEIAYAAAYGTAKINFENFMERLTVIRKSLTRIRPPAVKGKKVR